jgi:hypothetical protein
MGTPVPSIGVLHGRVATLPVDPDGCFVAAIGRLWRPQTGIPIRREVPAVAASGLLDVGPDSDGCGASGLAFGVALRSEVAAPHGRQRVMIGHAALGHWAVGGRWTVTRVTQRAVYVTNEPDQCTPAARYRLWETRTEVRIEYAAPTKVADGGCGLVLLPPWSQSDRALRLRSPLGHRTIVLEYGPVTKDDRASTCSWIVPAMDVIERARRFGRTAPILSADELLSHTPTYPNGEVAIDPDIYQVVYWLLGTELGQIRSATGRNWSPTSDVVPGLRRQFAFYGLPVTDSECQS